MYSTFTLNIDIDLGAFISLKSKNLILKSCIALKYLNFQRPGTPRHRDSGAQAPARSGNDDFAAAQVEDTSKLLAHLQRRTPAELPAPEPRAKGGPLPELAEAVSEGVPQLAPQRALLHCRDAEQPAAERRQRNSVKLNLKVCESVSRAAVEFRSNGGSFLFCRRRLFESSCCKKLSL